MCRDVARGERVAIVGSQRWGAPVTLVEEQTVSGPLVDEAEALFEEARARTRRRRRRGGIAAALVVASVAIGYLAGGGGGSVPADSRQGTGGRPAASPALRVALATQVRVQSVGDLAASDGALWVLGSRLVTRLDAATGRVIARIRTPATGDDSHIAAGDGSVWITSGLELGGEGIVYRIDPSTDRVVAAIRVGGIVLGIALGAGRVWVARPSQGPGEVIRIDPRTNRVDGPPIKVAPGPEQVAFGGGAVWVQNTSPESVVRIDPATGRVSTIVGTDAVDYGSFVVGAVAVGYSSLWTVRNDALTRFDPRTGRVVASVRIPRAQRVAIGAGEVWVLASPRSRSPTLFYPIKHTGALWEVDPRSNRIVGKPMRLDASGPIAVTAAGPSVWVADLGGEALTRLRLVACHASGCN
jgi:DNA-binding beta-propeller fold protein YncE